MKNSEGMGFKEVLFFWGFGVQIGGIYLPDYSF